MAAPPDVITAVKPASQNQEESKMKQKHHVFEGERLGAFSDAVFAIVATIMVIPLKLSESDIKDLTSRNGEFILTDWLTQGDFFLKLSTYLVAYLVVVQLWYSHNKLFRLVDKIDDFLSWINLIYLLFVSFLPASIMMTYSFPRSSTVLTITICNIILVNTTMIVATFLAFRQKSLLHPQLLNNPFLLRLKITMYVPLLVSSGLGIIGILFSWVISRFEVGFAFFYSMSFIPSVVRIGFEVFFWCRRSKVKQPIDKLTKSLMRTVVSKERLTAFSDGVFSIVATLLILDITTIEIPNAGTTSEKEVHKFLNRNKYELFTYLATFFIVGLLWFVHHSMLQFFKEITSWLTAFNSLSLLFVGLVPLGAGLISEFSEGSNAPDEVASIQTFSVLLVLASLSQLILWTVAHLNSADLSQCKLSPSIRVDWKKCLTDEIDNFALESIQLVKLLIFPCLGLIVYVLSFSERVVVHHMFTVLSLVTPLLFILPRAVVAIKALYESRFSVSARKESTSQVLQIQKDKENLKEPLTNKEYKLFGSTSSTVL